MMPLLSKVIDIDDNRERCLRKVERSHILEKGDKEVKIVVVDYSALYYSRVAKTAVPHTQSGKFVQLRHDDTEYLVFSPREFAPYHADIVERFCKDKDIPGVYSVPGKRFIIHDPAWVVVGGGKFELDTVTKNILLRDNSMAYGRFDSDGLRDKIHTIKKFRDYEVRIK
jgi:hypothetical protein